MEARVLRAWRAWRAACLWACVLAAGGCGTTRPDSSEVRQTGMPTLRPDPDDFADARARQVEADGRKPIDDAERERMLDDLHAIFQNQSDPARAGAPAAALPSPQVKRSQRPESHAPANAAPPAGPVRPASLTSVTRPALPADRPRTGAGGEAQVRIVANVGTVPVYQSEVDEAVHQRLPEILSLPEAERPAKEKQIFHQELKKIIEREMILDEMFARLKKVKGNALQELEEAADKDANHRLGEFKHSRHIASDEEFKALLQAQGLSVAGLRRQLRRNFMMSVYVRQLLAPRVDSISLAEIRDYYDEHPDEYKADDAVKWQDLFVNPRRCDEQGRPLFRSRAEAKQFAEHLADLARRGEDFAKLVGQFDGGDSSFRQGAGIGEHRGDIRPLDVEETVFALKAGEVAVVEMEPGFHIVRVAERTYAGRRPFDEKTQLDIRKKLQSIISEQEYRRLVDTLWRRVRPQVLVD